MPVIAARRAGVRRSRPLLTAVKLGNGPATSFGFGAEANQAFAFTVSTATTITRLDFHVLSGGPSSPTNITVGIADSTFSGGTITRANVPWVGAPGTMVWPNSSAQVLSVNVGPAACVPGTTYYIVLEGPTDASLATVACANGAPVVEGPVSLTGAYRFGTLAANNWLNTGTGVCPCVDIWGVITGPGPADNFNRVDSATTLNPASDGGSWTADFSGVFGVSSNTAYLASWPGGLGPTSGANFALARRNAGQAAMELTVDITRSSTAGASFLVVGYDPATTFSYELTYDSSGTFGTVSRSSTDGHPTMSTGVAFTGWTGSTTSVRFRRDSAGVVSVFQLVTGSWVLKASFTDAFPLPGVWAGIASNSVGVDHWDNFAVLLL